MRKYLLLLGSLFTVALVNAQGVGIGTTTPNPLRRLTILSANTDSNTAVFIDGNTKGQALQIVRGGTGIGPYLPNNRFSVITDDQNAGIDTAAAILGLSLSPRAALEGGVYGGHGNDSTGVGVQGVGYYGYDFAPVNDVFEEAFDAGVYGSGYTGVIGFSLYESGVRGLGNTAGVVAQAFDFGLDDQPSERYGIFASAAEGGDFSSNYAGYFDGDVNITGSISKGSGTFKIDHPLDPANKYLYHSFVESPDMMNIYNGTITTDAQGLATVTMPSYFNALNKDFRYQLTAIGTFAQAIVKNEISGNTFTIQTSVPNVKISWQVTGIRNDKFANAHRVVPEVAKEKQYQGFYLHPKEWGLSLARGIAAKAASNLRKAPNPLLVKLNPSVKAASALTQRKNVVKRLERYSMNGNALLINK